MFTWKKYKALSTPNLHILCRGAEEIGFIYKPRDTKTDKNAWRCHAGIGHAARFLGHRWNMRDAKQFVCDSI